MDTDKKYSAQEAAIAVLKKAGEMLKGSKLAKVEVHIHEKDGAAAHKAPAAAPLNSPANVPAPAPKHEVNATPADGIQHQQSPEANPHEEKEGNNPEWGNEPGHYKLAKFCGHMGAKRKMKA